MATPALIVVVAVAFATVLALTFTVVALMQHVRMLSQTLTEMRSDLQPALEQLQADAAVAQAELERISQAASELSAPE